MVVDFYAGKHIEILELKSFKPRKTDNLLTHFWLDKDFKGTGVSRAFSRRVTWNYAYGPFRSPYPYQIIFVNIAVVLVHLNGSLEKLLSEAGNGSGLEVAKLVPNGSLE